MTLEFCVLFVLMVSIAVPEVIFTKIGLNAEEITVIPFVLIWIVIFSVMHLFVKILLKTVKYLKNT